MKHMRVALPLLLFSVSAPATAQSSIAKEARDSSRAALVRDVSYLASERLAGRATGSPGNDSASVYLARSYQAMQVSAVVKTKRCDSAGACQLSYLQGFHPPAFVLRRAGIDTTATAFNVVAAVEGTDPTLAGEWLVIGAHYDHLGRTGFGVLDPYFASEPHLGADDNASGTAAVLEIARRLASAPMRRPVMFVNFGAEELGEFGSADFVAHSPIPLDSIIAMFNFDMVGHLGDRRLQLFGLGSSREWGRIIDSANVQPVLRLDRHDEMDQQGTGSDHDSFNRVGVPAVLFFTGLHSAYHTKEDTIDRIDFDGMMSVIDFAERIIRSVGSRTERLSKSGRR
jgi:hypothetical protein